MAQLFLKNETHTVGANSTASSYGATGTKETLVVAAGATVTVDQNIERIELSGTSSAYTYSVAGNVVTVKSGTVAVATYTVANGDKTIAFADGSAALVFTKLDVVTLGGQAISSTTSSALTGIALNKTDVSASAASVNLSVASTVNEGSAITYTATLSSAAATELTIPYTLSGTGITTADFTGLAALTGNISIAAGALTGTLTLNVAADTTTEGTENLTVALGAATSSVVTTIVDTSVATNPVTVNAVGTFPATAAKDIFNVTLGNYTATINGFNAGDKIIGPSGVTPTLVQPSFTDGQVGLQYAANSQVAVIILTGLTNAQDGLMFQPSDLNNTGVFGTGSLA